MPVTLTGLKVFIASPGGLDDERLRFKKTLLDFNEDDAQERGVAFIPIGWEMTVERVGRAQELINEEVRGCDYCILMLWDRWGTPPSENGEYSSGTEEEYQVARECLVSPDYHMKDIVVAFKGVDKRQMSDPGDELSRVLDFRRSLEESHSLLYATFDEIDEFERLVRKHLQRWIRDHEGVGSTQRRGTPPGSSGAPGGPPPTPPLGSTDDVVNHAKSLTREGRYADAESLLASAVVDQGDPDAISLYARILRRVGRVSESDATSERLLEIGLDLGDHDAVIDGLINLALSKRKQGKLDKAEEHLRRGIALAEGLGDDFLGRVGYMYDNLGLTLRQQGRLAESVDMHEKAVDLRKKLNNDEALGYSYNNLGIAAREQGDLDRAKRLHSLALEHFRKAEKKKGVASALGNLGIVLERAGSPQEAESHYKDALRENEAIPNQRGIAINYAQLAWLALQENRVPEAEEYAQLCLAMNESIDDPAGVASALQLLGRIMLQKGRSREALELLESGLEIHRAAGSEMGIIRTLMDLTPAYSRNGKELEAKRAITEAGHRAVKVGVAQLGEEIRAISVALDAATS